MGDGCGRFDAQNGGSTVHESEHIEFAKEKQRLDIYAESVKAQQLCEARQIRVCKSEFYFFQQYALARDNCDLKDQQHHVKDAIKCRR